MCIYLGTRDHLTYSKREHIFPAGLGGMRKLAHGVVSDQANELFSPLELSLMRKSSIAVCRAFEGPGKRGSLNPAHASHSEAAIGTQENGGVSFTYLSKGTPHVIPCFMREGQTIHMSFDPGHTDAKAARESLVRHMRAYNGRHLFYTSRRIPAGCLLIGYLEGKYYVASPTRDVSAEQIEEEIQRFINSGHFLAPPVKLSGPVLQDYIFEEGADHTRVYAKIAFNVLAHLRGADYAAAPCFDGIRAAILGNGGTELEELPSARRDRVAEFLPKSAHACTILNYDGALFADVRLYNYWGHTIKLCDFGTSDDFMVLDGFICDWRNREEYTLGTYLHHKCR